MEYEDELSGGSMSRAHDVHDDAIMAFLMFCLEIYQAEQQRKRNWQAVTLHAFGQPASNPYRMILSH